MRKLIKWIGFILGGLLALLIVSLVSMYAFSSYRLNRTYNVQPDPVDIPEDAAAVGHGAYLYASNCAGCHGDGLGGKAILDDPAIGYLPATNLTAGQGGVATRYTDADWVRAIRHGIRYDGKPLMVMPSTGYWYMSDEDLGALIAYMKTASPVNQEMNQRRFSPMAYILISVGAFGDVLAAEVIDHNAPRPDAPEPGVTAAYGDYLVKIGDCSSCHGSQLAGGQSPEPGAPFSPNITPGGDLANWSEADFISAMRTGVTPNGSVLDPAFMPWEEYARKTDDDLSAIYLYLQLLQALETNTK
jgi:mono/diheme cytochrome c family protein